MSKEILDNVDETLNVVEDEVISLIDTVEENIVIDLEDDDSKEAIKEEKIQREIKQENLKVEKESKNELIEIVDEDFGNVLVEEELNESIPIATTTALVEQIDEDFGNANIGFLEEQFRATEKQTAIEKEVTKRIEWNNTQEDTKRRKIENEELALKLKQRKKRERRELIHKISKGIISVVFVIVFLYVVKINPTLNRGLMTVVDFGKALFSGQNLEETTLIKGINNLFTHRQVQQIKVTIDSEGNIISTDGDMIEVEEENGLFNNNFNYTSNIVR